MSYRKFRKTTDEFSQIFSLSTKVSKIRDFPNKKLNVVLSSESFISSLLPILEKMLGDEIDNKKVVLIPNAGVGTEKVQMSYNYLVEFTTINNMYLKQLDLERWPKDIILESLHSCDVISISGGMVSRLLRAIDALGIRDELIEIINSGKPFFGFSAGSMVMSDTTQFAQHYMGEPDPEVAELSPLGIVDFEIYPHFEDTMLSSVKELASNLKEAYAVRPHEALVITDGQLLKVGEPIKIA